jgi:hypothetical protein
LLLISSASCLHWLARILNNAESNATILIAAPQIAPAVKAINVSAACLREANRVSGMFPSDRNMKHWQVAGRLPDRASNSSSGHLGTCAVVLRRAWEMAVAEENKKGTEPGAARGFTDELQSAFPNDPAGWRGTGRALMRGN